MITSLCLALIGVLALSTALLFGLTGHVVLAISAAVLGLAWLALEAPLKSAANAEPAAKRLPYGGGWVAGLGLAAFCVLAAASVLMNLSGWLALFLVALALAAWDLARLERRLQEAVDPAAARRIERRHLARLGLALAIGGGLGAVALSVRITLGFAPALALGAFALVALGLAAREVRRG